MDSPSTFSVHKPYPLRHLPSQEFKRSPVLQRMASIKRLSSPLKRKTIIDQNSSCMINESFMQLDKDLQNKNVTFNDMLNQTMIPLHQKQDTDFRKEYSMDEYRSHFYWESLMRMVNVSKRPRNKEVIYIGQVGCIARESLYSI